jgi:hypothetical protein
MRTSPYLNNSLSYFLILYKRNIFMGTWEHIKLGEIEIQIEIKRELFTVI